MFSFYILIRSEDLSTHEKRMAALKRQILELETENVGPKDWVLMGEADSRSRPQNSLLEEDLEFDRVMKAIPVITEEVVKSLEERIKTRILENRFDDVVRIRPLDDKPFLPSRFFDLKDTKSTQSLAQIYEDEYVAAQTDGVAGDDRDGKLKKEHEEIEKLWESISYKLDALCNTHFTPKQVCLYSSMSTYSTDFLISQSRKLRYPRFQTCLLRQWSLHCQPLSLSARCLPLKRSLRLRHQLSAPEANSLLLKSSLCVERRERPRKRHETPSI